MKTLKLSGKMRVIPLGKDGKAIVEEERTFVTECGGPPDDPGLLHTSEAEVRSWPNGLKPKKRKR